ncbi:MAG: ArsR/SmtB family transcription factor [Arenicellales bacterium]
MIQPVQDSFKALADPTRRRILMHLGSKDMTIGELTDHFDMTRAAVKKHLNILEKGQLISVHKSGRERINRLEPKSLKPVSDWLNYFEQFWDERLATLKNAIETEEENNNV